MSTDLEIRMIRKFVVKGKQERYVSFVSSGKNRKKFLDELSHFDDFDWDKFDQEGGGFSVGESEIISRLSLLGVNNTDTILIFGDAQLIYFQGEPPGNRYISKVL